MNKQIVRSILFFLVGGIAGFTIGRIGVPASSLELQKLQAQIEQAKKFFINNYHNHEPKNSYQYQNR